MLIFICSLPRSGGTLLYQLVKEICEQAGLCQGRGFAKESYHSGVVKSEYCRPWMAERVKAGNALAFGSYRDLRDVIVSMRMFYTRRSAEKLHAPKQWTVSDVLEYRHDLLDDYYCWREVCDTWFRYEQGDYAGAIIDEVSLQLNVPLSLTQKQAIIDEYDIATNEQRTHDQKPWMDAGSGSMLTRIHISPTRGKSTWRDALSPEDLALVQEFGGEWLREHGYQ